MTVRINEQEYELHFGMMALELFYKSTGTVERDSLFGVEQITAIVWGALKNGAYRQQRALPLTFADVSDWVEDLFFEEEGQALFASIAVAFNDSKAVKKMAEKGAEDQGDTKKKKTTTKTSLKRA